jgi:Fur family transcriptional regulator, ferric uptake regulator
MSNKIDLTLKEHNLRITEIRQEVLDSFVQHAQAFSHADLERLFLKKFDRVTLYRTLKTFLDTGIIHKVLDDHGTKYALCKTEACSHQHHQHNHVHFKCDVCGQTTCLDHVHVPEITLGFVAKEINFLAAGICNNCQ